jgi:hypothetical protein
MGMRIARVHAGGFTPMPWRHATVSWKNSEEAQQRFLTLKGVLPTAETRQITAELLQANTQGCLSINLHPDCWSVWLQAEMKWNEHADCCRLIESLGRHCTWTDTGAIIECAHG